MGIIALLIAVGLVLLFLETLLPGLIAGALGMLSLAAAVGYAYLEYDARTGNMTLGIVLLLLGAGKSTLRLAPPLVVDESDVDTALAIIDGLLGELD